MNNNSDNPWRMIGLVGTLGLEIVFFIIAGVWIGKTIDHHFGTDPTWLAVGIIGGLLLGIASALFTLKTFIKD